RANSPPGLRGPVQARRHGPPVAMSAGTRRAAASDTPKIEGSRGDLAAPGFAVLLSKAALVDGNVMTRVGAEINLAWPRDFLLRVEKHFFPLRDPSRS